ncbi:hypothetical protein BD779DRAFT_1580168 [Infundibulicybe gibba]|nr:hypothetical protein BD779DRAFT_1580168 [Infundibulicybe gibba]
MNPKYIPSQSLSDILAALGGPNIPSTEFEWALEVPAGKALLEWIAAQTSDVESGEDGLGLEAALARIALEGEEVDILTHAKGIGQWSLGPDVPSAAPPSRLRKRAEFMDRERALLESETELLKARLSQTKVASQKMKNTIKSLQSLISEADEGIERSQERIAELALESDVSIGTSLSAAIQLLHSFGASSPPTSGNDAPTDRMDLTHPMRASLSRIAALRPSIATTSQACLDEARLLWQQLDPASVGAQASELVELLRQWTPDRVRLAEECAYADELWGICSKLDDPGPFKRVLDGMSVRQEEGCSSVHDVDVRGEVERAWARDQADALEYRSGVLKQILSEFEDNIINPLNQLYTAVSATDEGVRGAEALVGALIEELEEAVDEVRSGKQSGDTSPGKRKDEELERELTETMKRLKDLRPSDSRPLVLLQRNDLVEEMTDLRVRAEALNLKEATWAWDHVQADLRALRGTTDPILTAAYMHSPMNTSPPLSMGREVEELARSAERQGESLGGVVARLQKDTEHLGGDQSRRRMTAFIRKWTDSGKT